MKRNLTIIIFLLSIFSFIMFTGCPSPMNPIDLDDPSIHQPTESESGTFSSGTIETGVTLSIPWYAPWIGIQPVSRAYGFTDSVEVTVYDSGLSVIYNDTFEPTYDVNYQIECDIILPPGTGYTVDIDIYNHVMSTEDPVVSGTSASFDIAGGAVTQVPVICIPNNPITAAAETVYSFSGMTAAIDISGNPLSSGTEFWYIMTAPASGYIEIAVAGIPEDVIFYYASFNEEGESIMSFGSNSGGPGPDVLSLPVTPGDVYYFGVVYGASAAGVLSGSVSWSEYIPHYLTDEDVPDPILRQLLASYTGKEFTIVGEEAPASPLSDADLATFNSLRCDGGDGADAVAGIINLTGLSYCTGLTYLGLGNNDFSGADAHFEELAGLGNLRSFDIGGSNLQNLDFIEYLINPAFDQFTFPDNPEVGLSEILRITSTIFPNLGDLGFNDYDTTGDGVADPISGSDWSAIVDQLALFQNLNDLRLGGLSLTDDMFNELITEVINIRPQNFEWLYLSSSLITDLSGLEDLPNLNCLEVTDTDISDLAPLQSLYFDGAFHDPVSWMQHDIDIQYCDLELWPGSPNRVIVDYLISQGVRVDYDNGNYLEEPIADNDWEYSGGYTVFGSIDFTAITDRDDVDYISLWINNSLYTRNIGYVLNNSEIAGYEADYSYINLEPNEQYYLSFSFRDTEDNEIVSKHIPLQSGESLSQNVIVHDPNDWGYTGGYTVSGTIDFSALTDQASIDHIYINIQDFHEGSNYLNYLLTSDNFSGNTAEYSIVNLDPVLQYEISIYVQNALNESMAQEYTSFQSTESLTQDFTLLDKNDWGYSGGGTLSGTIDFSYLSFKDDVDNISVSIQNTSNGDNLGYGLLPEDFSGYSVDYEIVNIDPSVADYGVSISACDNDAVGVSTSYYQSNLQISTAGMELDIDLRDANDWGYEGGGILSGSIDFSGVLFAADVDFVQIQLQDYSTGTWISRICNLYPGDFTDLSTSYNFLNLDPGVLTYQLSVYTASNSTGQYTYNYAYNIQVPLEGLIYDFISSE